MFKIITSSRVWAALIAIVFVILATYVPGIAAKLSQTDVVSGVIAIAAFFVAESVAGQSAGWGIFLKPRFWAVIFSLAFVFIRAFVPGFVISESMVQELVAAIGAASLGISYRPIGIVRT